MANDHRITYFAATDSRGKRTPFGLKAIDRRRHMYVIGKTGMGKSTLLENMAIQDIRNGEGLAFIDPHGGTADKLLEYVPPERIKDVVYLAPFDMNQPIAFNVMEDVGYDKRHLVVSGLMATFKKIWVDAWSARMEYILTNTLLALLEYPDATLLHVNRMYTDKAFRAKVVDNVKDPVVKDFWVREFTGYGDKVTQEATPAIQNKIGQFTSNPLIRNIIGQPKSSFDIRNLMDTQKILIINLSKGQVGETNMRLLGSMLTTRIFLAAMSRAELSAVDINSLPDFYFYVDEFQNFANDTFADILSEARKYKLSLLIAHQYVEQMDDQVRAAVFGNVGTTVAFRVGPFDAETLETVFTPEFTKEDLVNLTFAQIYLTLMIDGVGSRPFSALTFPRIEAPARTYKKEVIEASRQQFGAAREGIESQLNKEFEEAAASMPAPKSKSKPQDRPPLRAGSSATSSAPRIEQHDEPRLMVHNRDSERAPVLRPTPEPKGKTAQDLKDILRAMQASSAPKKPVVTQNQNNGQPQDRSATQNVRQQAKPQSSESPLKGALADVLKKHVPPENKLEQKESTEQKNQQNREEPNQNRQAQPPTKQPPHPPQAESSSKPYEVPEDVLRSLFKN
jgi:hypothetical protein